MTEIDAEVIEPRAAMAHLETALRAYSAATRFQTDANRLRSMCGQELRKIAGMGESAEAKPAEAAPVM